MEDARKGAIGRIPDAEGGSAATPSSAMPALPDDKKLAEYLRSRRLAWEAQGLGRLYDQDKEFVEIVMERLRPYLRTPAPELTEEEKREAVAIMQRAARPHDGQFFDDADKAERALSALLERYKLRRE